MSMIEQDVIPSEITNHKDLYIVLKNFVTINKYQLDSSEKFITAFDELLKNNLREQISNPNEAYSSDFEKKNFKNAEVMLLNEMLLHDIDHSYTFDSHDNNKSALLINLISTRSIMGLRDTFTELLTKMRSFVDDKCLMENRTNIELYCRLLATILLRTTYGNKDIDENANKALDSIAYSNMQNFLGRFCAENITSWFTDYYKGYYEPYNDGIKEKVSQLIYGKEHKGRIIHDFF